MNPATFRLTQSAARVLWACRGGHEPVEHLAEVLEHRLRREDAYDPRGPTRDECVKALRAARIEQLERETNEQHS